MRYFLVLFFLISNLSYAQQAQFPLTENLGQWENFIDFKIERSDHTLFIEKGGTWTFVLSDRENTKYFHDNRELSKTNPETFIVDHFAYKVHFINGNFNNKIKGEASPFYYNYFIGNDKNKHASNVHGYKSVYYKDVWLNIDLKVYFTDNNEFKYDFILHKNANLNDIQLKYEGQECLTLENNILTINGSFSLLNEELPITYLERTKEQIPCKYKLENDIISFDMDINTIEETVIIDPILVAATASGSTTENFGYTAGYDIDGNIYSGGESFTNGYPITTGAYQQSFFAQSCIAINKYNPTGSNLMYSTYLGGGGSLGTIVGFPVSLTCTESKKLIILGITNATNYPTSPNAIQTSHGGKHDIVLSILSENGTSLLGSTYLGGSEEDGLTDEITALKLGSKDHIKGMVNVINDEIVCVATISSANIPGISYPTSNTVSPDNPDAIVFKTDTLISTLLGHSVIGGSGADRGYGITTDEDQNIYICGATTSLNFPTTSNAYQNQSYGDSIRCAGYITKLTSNLDSIIASTYITTNSIAPKGIGTYFVSIDHMGNVYSYGIDGSLMLPQIGTGYHFGAGRVYIAQFNSNLSSLLATHKMGSNHSVSLGAFKVDQCDRVMFSSYSNSSFETTSDNIIPNGGMYVGILSPGGQNLSFGTYYTGNHVDGGTSQFSHNGSIYHAVCVPHNIFSCHSNAYSQNIMADYDSKVFKIDPELETISIEIDNIWPNMEFCLGTTHNFGTLTVGSLSNFSWYYDGQLVSHNDFYEADFNELGTHTLKVVGESECVHLSRDSIVFEVFEITPDYMSDSIQCIDGFVDFSDISILPPNFTGSITDWYWDFGDGNFSTSQHPTHSYSGSGFYDVNLTVTTSNGCVYDTLKELQVEIFNADIDFEVDSIFCTGDEVEFTPLVNIPPHIEAQVENYFWEFGDGYSSTDMSPTHVYNIDGQFDVTLRVILDNGCEYEITHLNILTVHKIILNMALLTDSISFPFDEPIEAYVFGSGYNTVEWFIDNEYTTSGDSLSFYTSTEEPTDEILITALAKNEYCEKEITKIVKLTNIENFYIPNAFTPNGDHLNDIFKPVGRQVDNAEYFMFKIHNRWGEQLFITYDNTEGWAGFNKRDNKVSAGVYVWTLELQTELSGRQTYNGWVTLIK